MAFDKELWEEIYGTSSKWVYCKVGDKVSDTEHGWKGVVVALSNNNPLEPNVKYDLTDEEIDNISGYYSKDGVVCYFTPQGGLMKL